MKIDKTKDKNIALYEGETIVIRGNEYVIPGMSFAQLEANAEDIDKIMTAKDEDMMKMLGVTSKIVHLAMGRNYPDLTLDEVKDMLDMRNMQKIIQAIMGGSGFQLAANNSGEALPVAKA